MGTRNLTCVVLNGEYKVAQYGQWDGYPSGQGQTALDFLRSVNLEEFKEKVGQCRFVSKERMEEIIDDSDRYPVNFNRDTAAEILQWIMDSESGLDLYDMSSFANDSLFCEWAYVIDLDKNTFEVYKGFNKVPLAETERFYNENALTNGYYGVALLHAFSLSALPTDGEFHAVCKEDEE